MKIIFSSDKSFNNNFDELLDRGKMDIEGVTNIVNSLLNEIKGNRNSS